MTEPRRVVSVVGTRPNYMKIAPIAALLGQDDRFEHVLVHTGQHYDRAMSSIFFEQLAIGAPDHMLGVGSAGHGVQTARVMERLEPLLVDLRPDVVLVPGDVNSTMAAALVASKLGTLVAHVESGLRSFDRTMPEEINRVVADAVADLLFIHSPEARQNLEREGVPAEIVFDVGNTMIDSLVRMLPRVHEAGMPARLGIGSEPYLLVTLHRPALTDGPLLAEAVAQLRVIAKEMRVVFPVHPRTRRRIEHEAMDTGETVLLDPLGYIEFIGLLASATAILTDSGGVQEESTYLGIPCFTLRDSTERPVTVVQGTNTLLGLLPELICEVPARAQSATRAVRPTIAGWDGRAAERVVEVLARDELPSRADVTRRLSSSRTDLRPLDL